MVDVVDDVVNAELDVGFAVVDVVVEKSVLVIREGRAVVSFCAVSMNDGKSGICEVTVVKIGTGSLSLVCWFPATDALASVA